MTTPNRYRGFRFPPEVIQHAVWLYHCFSLSLRYVELILAGSCRATTARHRSREEEDFDDHEEDRVDPTVPIEDTVGAMSDLVRHGKVRHLSQRTRPPAKSA
jgi:hypothetical protein